MFELISLLNQVMFAKTCFSLISFAEMTGFVQRISKLIEFLQSDKNCSFDKASKMVPLRPRQSRNSCQIVKILAVLKSSGQNLTFGHLRSMKNTF